MPSGLGLFQVRQQLRGDRGALQALGNVRLHGDGELPPLAPHDARLPGEYRRGDVQQRDETPRGRGHISLVQIRQGIALGQGLAQHDLDQLVTIAVLAHRAAREQGARSLRDGLAAHAQGTGLGLVHLQTHRLDRLVPVVVHATRVGVLAHLGLDLVGLGAQHLGVRPHHPKLHRVRHRRAVGQQFHTPAHLGELLSQQSGQLGPEHFAGFQIGRLHDQLRHVGLRKDLIQRQVKTRHARAHPSRHRFHALFLRQALLHAARDVFAGLDGRALGQPKVHHDLGTAGVREELLLHLAHAHHAQGKQSNGDANRLPAVRHTPGDPSPKVSVKRRVVHLRRIKLLGRHHMRRGLEQQRAQIRHKKDRRHPTDQKRHHRDRKNRKGVLARHRLGHANRQEPGGGDQGAREHGHGRELVGEGGRAHLVVALLHFAHHHLHRDDGVVHQQAQSDDERAQRNFVQADVQVMHGQKGHRQHQRDGDAHHQTGADVQRPAPPQRVVARPLVQAQCQKAHRQHNHHGFDQHLDELVDRARHRTGLVLHLHQGHACRQTGLSVCDHQAQCLAQSNDVAAFGHGHAQCNDLLPLMAHLHTGRIGIATSHRGDVRQANLRARRAANRQGLQILQTLELAAHPHLHHIRG